MKRTMVAACLLAACAAQAELAPEKLGVRPLPPPSPHWVWVNDISGFTIDGKAFLVDGDSGTMLGMLSTGGFHDTLAFDPAGKAIYSSDTYYSRGTRGERTDVISIHDAATLSFVGEVVIPPKQLLSVSNPNATQILDDGRFVVVYNFTPTQTVSVVDVQARKFVGEIDTAGCGMVYAAGPRRFLMMCANGSMLAVTLDDAGKPVAKKETARLFDPAQDLLNEDAVRSGDTWRFVSYKGDVYSVDVGGTEVTIGRPWALQQGAERDQWRPGGYQLFAVHAASGRLYVAMHEGGKHTHKVPGTEIWVYDVATQARTARWKAHHPVTSLAVSSDDAPLLYGANAEHPALEIYDGSTGKHLRTVDGLGMSPIVLQPR